MRPATHPLFRGFFQPGGGGHARLEVSDTGIGIPEAEQPYLFDRFFRASTVLERAIPGTGLGLSIVKTIVEAYGGTVSASNDPDGGALFEVRLPRARAA